MSEFDARAAAIKVHTLDILLPTRKHKKLSHLGRKKAPHFRFSFVKPGYEHGALWQEAAEILPLSNDAAIDVLKLR